MKAVRVLIVDDHEVVRVGVRSILAMHRGYVVCGEAADGQIAVTKALQLKPDLVILDIGLPLLNGLEVARRILSQSPGSSVLILTEFDSERIMYEALQVGISGFVLKSDPASDLFAAAEALLQGRTCYTSRMTQMVLELAVSQRREPTLTDREREVVQLVVEGKCSREIGTLLNVSKKTVETHRSNVMRKLKINSTVELILYAIRNEIVHLSRMDGSSNSAKPWDSKYQTSGHTTDASGFSDRITQNIASDFSVANSSPTM
jgi:DNA-binding NarL/FixJ family response regulator